MTTPSDNTEDRIITLLQEIIDLDREKDVIPAAAMRHIHEGWRILIKRRSRKRTLSDHD